MYGGFIKKNLFFINKKYKPKNLLLNGRSSLALILKNLKPSKIYLPFYICDTVINTLVSMNINYNFYPINNSLKPKKIIKLKNKEEYILIVPYFGLLKFNDHRNHKHIYDLTGSFFYPKKVATIETATSATGSRTSWQEFTKISVLSGRTH